MTIHCVQKKRHFDCCDRGQSSLPLTYLISLRFVLIPTPNPHTGLPSGSFLQVFPPKQYASSFFPYTCRISHPSHSVKLFLFYEIVFSVILRINPTRRAVLLSIFISLLYTFRATMCPSSGEITVSMRHWYLSLCMGGVWSAGWIETTQPADQMHTYRVTNTSLIFVVPCIMLNSEIIPTRCKNCVYSSQWLYM